MLKPEQKQATEEIVTLCDELGHDVDEIESMLYAALVACQQDERAGELFDALQRLSKVVGESHFWGIGNDAKGVLHGRVSWSAVSGDGKRLPKKWLDCGIGDDWCYYLRGVKRVLDESTDAVGHSPELAVFAEYVDEVVAKIDRVEAALQSLV